MRPLCPLLPKVQHCTRRGLILVVCTACAQWRIDHLFLDQHETLTWWSEP
jgi:hypothetical protein